MGIFDKKSKPAFPTPPAAPGFKVQEDKTNKGIASKAAPAGKTAIKLPKKAKPAMC